MFKLITAFFSLLDTRGRRQAFLLLVPMFAVSLLEMASIGMVVPLLQAIVGQTESSALARLRVLLPEANPERTLIFVAAVFAALTVVKNAAVLGMIHAVNRFIALKLAEFQQRLYQVYLAQPVLFHGARNSAQALRNLTLSVNVCFDGIRIVLTVILDLVLVAGACVLLFWAEPAAATLAASVLIALAIVYHRIAAPRLRRWGYRSHEVEVDILKRTRETLDNIKLIKLTNTAGFFENSFRVLTDTRARLLSYTLTSLNVPRTLIESILIVGFLVCLVVLLNTTYSLVDLFPVIGLFGMVALRLMPSMNRLMSGFADIRQRSAPIEELTREMALPARESGAAAPEKLPFCSAIELSRISVSYGGGRDRALKNVNLVIRRGESVGLVGPSGSGKSTLADVIMGLTAPVEGTVRVDGIDIAGRLESWRNCVGYVPQDIFLLDDTIRRNIAFGIPDDRIDERRLAQAVAFACLEGVIAALPEGLIGRGPKAPASD